MPIADGYAATAMIRALEARTSSRKLSKEIERNSRVPIFAVSATLLERERSRYIDAGFDGWVMKPIDFARLNDMLRGLEDFNARKAITYSPGKWDKGGWFGCQ
ncbi:hypothetical protein N7495_002756 [Penicillium taxi]|uniref:uncharacterized protein n=1 Tax=Penicillium taxi TaxID=168475 RepID=UPI0025455C8B|nr:uncharacterized protein N7495_002756 [Penicillium taxi]KAJ5902228.1 hypothetical protein N7495_002756 [Penicillium taxi]